MPNDRSVKPRQAFSLAAALAGLFVSLAPLHAQTRFAGRNDRDNRLTIAASSGSSAAETVHNGLDELLLGHRAMSESSLVAADAHYRNAWQDPTTRADAADALTRVYAKPDFRLRADESAVRRNFSKLSSSFRRFETDHFVLISDSGEDWTLERGRLLERAREQYFRVAQKMKLPIFPHRHKLICVLFDTHADYQAFARQHDGLEARWVAGYYATASNRVVFYNDATSPAYAAANSRITAYEEELHQKREQADLASRRRQRDRARHLLSSAEELESRIEQERSRIGKRAAAYSTAKTVHEAIHLLAFNTGMQLGDRDYPFWLSEGLATCFETENATLAFGPDRAASAGSRRQRYEELRRKGDLRPLRELVTLSEAPIDDAQGAETMYSQSYALFHHLFRTDPEAIGRYLSALMQEPSGRIPATRQAELFQAYFGSPESVQAGMMR
jgi:hypothetical protein